MDITQQKSKEVQAMLTTDKVKRFVILTVTVIIMSSCESTQKVTTTKEVPMKTTLATKLAEKELPAVKIPSYPENVAFSEASGFNEYVIGPGDLLAITEWKTTGASVHNLPVRPDGKVSFSFFEDIKVAGLTPTQVDNLITSQLEGFVKKPRIDVVVTEYRSKKVSFFGEINRVSGTPLSGPGIYPLKGKTKLTELLLDAGSETERADLRNVELIRRGKLYKLNLLSAMTLEDLSQDVLLENDDKIKIPLLPQYAITRQAENQIFVFGEVNSQGLHRLAGKPKIADLIAKAGGTKITAVWKDVRVIRGTPENPVIIHVNLKRLFKESDLSQNVSLKDGDIVYVPKTFLGKTNDLLVKQIGPILSMIMLHPAKFREDYTTGGGLRMDTDVDERSLREFDRLGGFSGSNP
jgi:polysaccharide export outer membrane protein